MFLLLPLWPKSTGRVPVLTLTLILINVAATVATWPNETRQSVYVTDSRWREIVNEVTALLRREEGALSAFDLERLNAEAAKPGPSAEVLDAVVARVNENAMSGPGQYRWQELKPVYASYRAARAGGAPHATVMERFGYVPHSRAWYTIVTHQFLHAGFWHLFFNMLFLWVVGATLESSLGVGIPSLYILGGVAAALIQERWTPNAAGPLIGASGAVAALMGFSLIWRPQAKVTLFYIAAPMLMPRFGVFDSPLWFFFPAWLLLQIAFLAVTSRTGSPSVAYAAHVGGFLFGALLASVSRLLVRPAPTPPPLR
jgi:membrane associated rhomboid family serine protease